MSTPRILQNSHTLRLGLPLALGLTLTIGLLLAMAALHPNFTVLAQGSCTRYVAPAPTGDDSGNDCETSSNPCATVQHAVDEAGSGDVICVATGTYTDSHVHPRNDITTTGTVTQVVYISKTVTIRGGYTTAFTDPSDPVANLTTLDAGDQGRVLYITGDISPTIEGLRLMNGDASGLGGHLTGPVDWDAGGGTYAITATVTMNSNQVSDNFARYGGGLYFQNSPDLTLTDNTISDNRAGSETEVGWGGGAYFIDCSEAKLNNNTVSENVGGKNGGGLFFNNSPKAILSNNTISNNVANHQGSGMKNFGGVCFHLSDDAMLIGNTISGNSAANQCGGVCFDGGSNATLVGNIVISNSAGSEGFLDYGGGGLFFGGSTDAKLIGNIISENSAKNGGGGISALASSIALTGNTISSNHATQGGGLFLNGGDATLDRNLVTGNVASPYPNYPFDCSGGGLVLYNTKVALTNNVVADNQVEVEGSGLYIVDSSPSLLHTTIARNSGGDGSGVHITGTLSTVAMTNTILASQTLGVYVEAGNSASLNGVLWYDNGANYAGPGTIVASNEHTGDPAFADDGYHLTDTSAAIDKVVTSVVTDDIDGQPRPAKDGYDLGADEFYHHIYLPVILKDR